MTETNTPHSAVTRHYGMDWLRIAAFALLIVYHIAMVFAPWSWVIHSKHAVTALIVPMALLTPWRLALLFAVSGFASYHLLNKSRSPVAFMRARNKRLLIPLAFGMAVVVPPEMWVRVVGAGYPGDYWHFWAHDYWRYGEFWGRTFPSWEHLWFVVYLWVYSGLLALALWCWGDQLRAGLTRAAHWLGQRWRLLWVPMVMLGGTRLVLTFLVEDEHGLLRDWAGHAYYFPMFIAGFTLASAPHLWPAIHRLRWLALAAGSVAATAVVGVELSYPGTMVPPHWAMALLRVSQVSMGWCVSLLLFGVADRFLNRDHRWRGTLAEAVFPFYLVHQPVIVVLAWVSMPWDLGPAQHFLLIACATFTLCLSVYWVGRSARWVRPLIGLGPKRQARAMVTDHHGVNG